MCLCSLVGKVRKVGCVNHRCVGVSPVVNINSTMRLCVGFRNFHNKVIARQTVDSIAQKTRSLAHAVTHVPLLASVQLVSHTGDYCRHQRKRNVSISSSLEEVRSQSADRHVVPFLSRRLATAKMRVVNTTSSSWLEKASYHIKTCWATQLFGQRVSHGLLPSCNT